MAVGRMVASFLLRKPAVERRSTGSKDKMGLGQGLDSRLFDSKVVGVAGSDRRGTVMIMDL